MRSACLCTTRQIVCFDDASQTCSVPMSTSSSRTHQHWHRHRDDYPCSVSRTPPSMFALEARTDDRGSAFLAEIPRPYLAHSAVSVCMLVSLDGADRWRSLSCSPESVGLRARSWAPPSCPRVRAHIAVANAPFSASLDNRMLLRQRLPAYPADLLPPARPRLDRCATDTGPSYWGRYITWKKRHRMRFMLKSARIGCSWLSEF